MIHLDFDEDGTSATDEPTIGGMDQVTQAFRDAGLAYDGPDCQTNAEAIITTVAFQAAERIATTSGPYGESSVILRLVDGRMAEVYDFPWAIVTVAPMTAHEYLARYLIAVTRIGYTVTVSP